MDVSNLPGFGEEVLELKFEGFSDWFLKINNPFVLWQAQPTYILAQAAYLFGAAVNLVHALRNGGRLPYLWLATLLHGVVVEIITYNLDDIDNFWHSQTPIIFLGRRLPLHIIALYPVFIYHASIAVSRMRLPNWAEPFAVGLMVVLIDIPYDTVSVKFLHWTWHDTDPNIGDRHYWVPWNSYYFHACFAASFTFWFHGWHRWIGNGKKWEANSAAKELLCTALAAMLGMPGGVLLFLPIYHPLHDLANVHSEVTFFMLLTMFLLIIWSADRVPKSPTITAIAVMRYYVFKIRIHLAAAGTTACLCLVLCHPALYHAKIPDSSVSGRGTGLMIIHLILHYSLFLGMVLFGSPENEVSIGLHEKTGPCNETAPIQTAFGTVLQKRHYLCVSDYDEDYFDFSCLPGGKPPRDGASWYTACGTPFRNRTEYIAVISTICLLAGTVFWNLYSSPNMPVKPSKTKKKEH